MAFVVSIFFRNLSTFSWEISGILKLVFVGTLLSQNELSLSNSEVLIGCILSSECVFQGLRGFCQYHAHKYGHSYGHVNHLSMDIAMNGLIT